MHFFFRNYFFVIRTRNNFLTVRRKLCIPNILFMTTQRLNKFTFGCRPNFRLLLKNTIEKFIRILKMLFNFFLEITFLSPEHKTIY